MRLLSIELTNFRQFKGTQKFDLEVAPDKPVVLIFGANGAGKTTFLNAFSWALYGDLSRDFELPERLINDDVWASVPLGRHADVDVAVTFEHCGERYEARRSARVRKESQEQREVSPSLVLRKTARDGSSVEVAAGQNVLDTILGRQMSRFFFFNGERIEKLISRGSYAEVKEDIKILLGLTQVERALKSLPRVEKKLGADVRKYGGDRVANLQEKIDDLREEQQKSATVLEDLKDKQSSFREEVRLVEAQLREHLQAAPIQRERDRLTAELSKARAALGASIESRRKLVSERGFLAFTAAVAERTTSLANELHEKGALPAPLKREFVVALLEEGTCICGSSLNEGSLAWQNVQSWRARAGLADVEASWQRLGGQVDQLRGARRELQEQLRDLAQRVDADQTAMMQLEERLSERTAELQRLGSSETEVAELEGKRNDLDSRISDCDYKIRRGEESIAETRDEIASQERQLEAAEVKDEIAGKARSRQQGVRAVEKALGEILAIREAKMSSRLDETIKEVFRQVTLKPYIPELDSDFELGLYKNVGGRMLPVQKSTGENQILSLSFVAAVSKLAREVHIDRVNERDAHEGWGEYPIVMDAAFGSLDLNYQREVARALSSLAPQMIVLVSKSQGMGEVADELRSRVSAVGIIVAHSSAKGADSETIEIDGREYPYFMTGAEETWSELREVDSK